MKATDRHRARVEGIIGSPMETQVYGTDLPIVPPQHDDDDDPLFNTILGDLSADLQKYGTLASSVASEVAADVNKSKQTPEQKKAADDAAKAKAAGPAPGTPGAKKAGMSTGAKVAIGGGVAVVFLGGLFFALRKKGRR